MTELDVRIVTLPPMRVICFNGFGTMPEEQAYTKASDWLKENGMWEARSSASVTGQPVR